MLDSGAAMSLFPAKFIDKNDYTGGRMIVKGAVGEKSLQTAIVTVEMEGEKRDMRVLVTKEYTTPLLGMDYPHFEDLWKQLSQKRAKQEHDSLPPPQQVLKTLKEGSNIDRKSNGVSTPAEAVGGCQC